MGLNLKYLVSIIGILKIISIVLGAISYSSGMHAYVKSDYNKNCFDGIIADPAPTSTSPPLKQVIELDTTTGSSEEVDKLPILWMERFFLYVTGICLFWSIVHLIVHVVKEDACESFVNRAFDFGFHFGGTILLIISGLFMSYTALKIDSMSEELCSDPENCQLLKKKLTGAASAFLTALVFFAISIKNVTTKNLFQTV